MLIPLPICEHRTEHALGEGEGARHRCDHPWTDQGTTLGVDDRFCQECDFRPGARSKRRMARRMLPRLDCVHLGAATGELVECPTCQGSTRVKVFQCSEYGQATIEKPAHEKGIKGCCQGCDFYSPAAALVTPVTRNLLYHIFPIHGSGVWQRNVAHLVKRIEMFNGKRVVAIMAGPAADGPDQVKAAFGGTVEEFLILPNDRKRREGASHHALWSQVETRDRSQVTFYAHAKGVMRPAVHPSVHLWTDIQYASCLDYWPLVEEKLREFPAVGSFKKRVSIFENSSWHFSGTFYWMRNADLFARDWRTLQPQWWAVESWPSQVFDPEEAGCLFWDRPETEMYDPVYVRDYVLPAWERWQAANAQFRKEWP